MSIILEVGVPLSNIPFQLYYEDCLKAFKHVPTASVDLIATDPPYFKVKKNAWDNQWPTVDEFLSWLDSVLAECERVLKPNGSIYIFCSPSLSAETELLVKERFNVLNHIVWRKPQGMHLRQHKEGLRKFFPASERIIFAEKTGQKSTVNAGYSKACSDLKKELFKPLINYFKEAKESLGISSKQINEATGTQMSSHWFSDSQWKLPSKEQYEILQKLFNQQLHRNLTGLRCEYKILNKKYHELKTEFLRLRRTFTVTKDVPYTDVWSFDPVQPYSGKHPCEKPSLLMEHIILSSSRVGDVVLDCFMGSGSTGKAALKNKRRFIGVEFEKPTFDKTEAELAAL